MEQMLLEDNDEANEIICKFINDRLIGLMEEIITDEVLFRKCQDGPIRAATLEELADAVPQMPKDLDDLMLDLDFAEDVALDYLPFGYPPEKPIQLIDKGHHIP